MDRPVFSLRLRPKKGVNPTLALRRGLKFLLRSCGLQALSVQEIPEQPGMRADAPPSANQTAKDQTHE
jgi:hypothetical protein